MYNITFHYKEVGCFTGVNEKKNVESHHNEYGKSQYFLFVNYNYSS